MKIVLLIVVCLCFFNVSLTAQQKEYHSQNSRTFSNVQNIIGLTPSAASEINGLAIGLMPITDSPDNHLTINGVNIEVGILSAFLSVMIIPECIINPSLFITSLERVMSIDRIASDNTSNALPDTLHLSSEIQSLDSMNNTTKKQPLETNKYEKPRTSINGLNISVWIPISHNIAGASFNFLGTNVYNGKGICISGLISKSKDLQGAQISGLINVTQSGNGMLSSLLNYSGQFNGFQIGLVNLNQNGSGLMIGLFNGSTHFKGVQIGLVNKINNLILPGINLSF